jgi:hypothetical protein
MWSSHVGCYGGQVDDGKCYQIGYWGPELSDWTLSAVSGSTAWHYCCTGETM